MMVAISLNSTSYSGKAPPPMAYIAKLLAALSLTRQDTMKNRTQKTSVIVMTIVANLLPLAVCVQHFQDGSDTALESVNRIHVLIYNVNCYPYMFCPTTQYAVTGGMQGLDALH